MRWRSVGLIWVIACGLLAAAWLTRDPPRAAGAQDAGPRAADRARGAVWTGVDIATATRIEVTDDLGAVVARRQRLDRDRWVIERFDASGGSLWSWPARDAFVASALRSLATAPLRPGGGAGDSVTGGVTVRVDHGDRRATLRLGREVLGGFVEGWVKPGSDAAPQRVQASRDIVRRFGVQRAERWSEPAPFFAVGSGPTRLLIRWSEPGGPRRVVLRRDLGRWTAVAGGTRTTPGAGLTSGVLDLLDLIGSLESLEIGSASPTPTRGLEIAATTPLGPSADGGDLAAVQVLRLGPPDRRGVRTGTATFGINENGRALETRPVGIRMDDVDVAGVLAVVDELSGSS